MPSRKKLRAGTGAEATILTKYIRPPQFVPHPQHRSEIILLDLRGKDYTFCYSHDNESGNTDIPILTGSCRFVKIVKEGDETQFFSKTYEEPNIPWGDSKAKRLLYTDLMNGNVPLESKDENNRQTMPLRDIYLMRPEYAEYLFSKFSSRLSSLRKTAQANNRRAVSDQEAFDLFVQNNPISYYTRNGYTQWQGSEQQLLLKKDIEDGIVAAFGNRKKEFWQSREEFKVFPLHVFRDKIKQEIRTAKYLHTLKERGKKGTYKYAE